jgi:signal transduction histidine kinase
MTGSITLPVTSDPQEMIGNLARLVEISMTLNSTLDPETLLEHILDSAVEMLDCEAASILLYSDTKRELRFAASTGANPVELAKIPVPLENSLAGKIFRENAPLVVNDVPRDRRHYTEVSSQTQVQVRSLLGVPMRIQKQKVGVIEAINKNQGVFSYSDVKLLAIIASLAAVAIDNARMVQELKEANVRLQEADEMKNRFMAVASHELRTPLGIILGYATFLKEEAQGELSEHAASVLNAALELRALVEDMTNMNMFYTGERDVKLEPVPLQEVIRSAGDEIASMMEARSNVLSLKLPPDPVIVNADPKKLKLAFVNVLNNAVRFSPEGSEIRIWMEVGEDAVLVAVQDEGLGIPPDKLDLVFEQFYQVEDHMTRRYGGLGLGLAITREIVNLHGGRIWAESPGLGHGSTFKIVLPR